MATTYASEVSGYANTTPTSLAAGNAHFARLRRWRCTVTYASQASGDTIVLANIPAGYVFAFGVLTADTSSGTATLAVGISGSTAKYKAAAAFTTTDTPTFFGKASAVSGSAIAQTNSGAMEQVIITTGTAALPASGTLVVDLYFSGS